LVTDTKIEDAVPPGMVAHVSDGKRARSRHV